MSRLTTFLDRIERGDLFTAYHTNPMVIWDMPKILRMSEYLGGLGEQDRQII